MHLHLFLNIDMSIRLLPATIIIILNKISQNAIYSKVYGLQVV